jgi:hypothetical protein
VAATYGIHNQPRSKAAAESQAIEDRANEIFIAAAPELYEALNACHMQLLQSNNRSEYAQEACDMALNALRKAEGRK